MKNCPFCLAPLNIGISLTNTCGKTVNFRYVCTRPPDHEGPHVACCPPQSQHILDFEGSGNLDILTFEINYETIYLL